MRPRVYVDCVYFLDCAGCLKIGRSTGPNDRIIRVARSLWPRQCYVRALIRTRSSRLETDLHKRFSSLRIDRFEGPGKTEWFDFMGSLYDYVSRLRRDWPQMALECDWINDEISMASVYWPVETTRESA